MGLNPSVAVGLSLSLLRLYLGGDPAPDSGGGGRQECLLMGGGQHHQTPTPLPCGLRGETWRLCPE